MQKLVILVDKAADGAAFRETWPRFVSLAQKMPGLRREFTSRVGQTLYGQVSFSLIYELFFDTEADMLAALATPDGRAAGKLLQSITEGKMALVCADHKEINWKAG